MILSYQHDVIAENLAIQPTAPDEPYITVTVSLTPVEAQEMIDTLDSNGSSERATRDPLARAVLEAIRDSGLANA
jgi:hypothetical protein